MRLKIVTLRRFFYNYINYNYIYITARLHNNIPSVCIILVLICWISIVSSHDGQLNHLALNILNVVIVPGPIK